jgi:hypothetical protein
MHANRHWALKCPKKALKLVRKRAILGFIEGPIDIRTNAHFVAPILTYENVFIWAGEASVTSFRRFVLVIHASIWIPSLSFLKPIIGAAFADLHS